MISEIYWIESFAKGRLGTMARPRGGDWLEDEVVAWKLAGVDIVASALTDEEMRELDIEKEAEFCRLQDIDFRRIPVSDICVPPSIHEWSSFISSLKSSMEEKKSVVAHCRMGIGRASMIAVSLMVAYGVQVDEAFQWMTVARGLSVPDTDEQRQWIVQFAESLPI